MLDPVFKARLRRARETSPLPPGLIGGTERLTQCLLALLFPPFEAPCRAGLPFDPIDRYEQEAWVDLGELAEGLDFEDPRKAFFAALPEIHAQLLEDARALDEGDPAARSMDEVILAYPGFRAVAVYRLAHALHGQNVPLIPRLMTEFAHRETGIDLHPGARIGRRFSIDHGTGVVVGETAEIGDGVKLYQGVTLGALSVRKDLAQTKRHPTLEDEVVVYANATILGGETVVGRGSVIGGNVWLTESVPPGSVVTGTPR